MELVTWTPGTADDTVLVVGGEESPSVEVSTADEYAFP